MKNLFDYATKELSQDAFLCWLFANYKCENEKLSEISVKLLSAFSIPLSADKIDNFQISKQWKYIDVLVQFEYDNEIHLIAIEDKTYSEEHEQLKEYNEELDGYAKIIFEREQKLVECHKVFYKTAVLPDTEKNRVEASNGWTIFDIEQIYDFFSKYSKTGSEILDDYIVHVSKLYRMSYHYSELAFSEWNGNNYIFKRYCDVDIKGKTTAQARTEIYQGKYAVTYLQKITKDNIVVELGLFFRDWAISAWIKCWENGKPHYILNPILRDYILDSLSPNLITQWEHKTYKNRILRVVKNPNEFESFYEFDSWISNCVVDFENIANDLRMKDGEQSEMASTCPKWQERKD